MPFTFEVFGPNHPMSREIRHQFILLYLRAFPHRTDDEITLQTQREIAHRDRFIIAFAGTVMVGFATWQYCGAPNERTAELVHFGVDTSNPAARGLADELMAKFEDDVDAFYRQYSQPGWRELFLWTHDDNVLAHPVYARAGFIHIFTWFGRYPATERSNGHERLYEKKRPE